MQRWSKYTGMNMKKKFADDWNKFKCKLVIWPRNMQRLVSRKLFFYHLIFLCFTFTLLFIIRIFYKALFISHQQGFSFVFSTEDGCWSSETSIANWNCVFLPQCYFQLPIQPGQRTHMKTSSGWCAFLQYIIFRTVINLFLFFIFV